jgi:hypothetical protein
VWALNTRQNDTSHEVLSLTRDVSEHGHTYLAYTALLKQSSQNVLCKLVRFSIHVFVLIMLPIWQAISLQGWRFNLFPAPGM